MMADQRSVCRPELALSKHHTGYACRAVPTQLSSGSTANSLFWRSPRQVAPSPEPASAQKRQAQADQQAYRFAGLSKPGGCQQKLSDIPAAG